MRMRSIIEGDRYDHLVFIYESGIDTNVVGNMIEDEIRAIIVSLTLSMLSVRQFLNQQIIKISSCSI